MNSIDPRLAAMFRPRSVAVVGATEDRNRVGGRPLHYLRGCAFQGAVYPINPKRDSIQGYRAYASLEQLPEAPDVAVVAVGGDQVLEVIRQCAARGVRSAVVMSSGFGETGAQGAVRQAQLVSEARALGVRLMGPNAQGVANFQTGAVLNFSTMFMEVAPQDGPVAVISQSGAASVMPYALLRERGVGVRYVVASGNDADASVCELALVAAADPDIRVLLLYIESLANPAVLAEVARLARERGAAVVALKSGRSAHGAKAAASHTGALVNNDALVDAFFAAHGIWRADDVHGLVNAVELYLACGLRPAQRLMVMSHSGAVGVVCADSAERLGLPLAELDRGTVQLLAHIMPRFATAQNPVDLTASLMTDGAMFGRTLDALAADPQGDMFLVGVPVAGEGYDLPGMAADTARFLRRTGKPVAVSAPQASVRSAFREAHVPVFGHETDALAALHQVSRHAALVHSAALRAAVASAERFALPAGTSRTLSEADSLALLQRAGLPVAPHRLCHSPREALQAWRELGPEVVVKACSATIPHKSEHALVFLDLCNENDVLHCYEECVARVRALQQPLDGVLVARRVRGRREFALGVRQDPMFGTAVMVSDGGKYVEALRDFFVLLHPFTEQDVLDQLAGLRIAPVLAGVRGEPPVDLQVVARAAVALGRFAAAHAEEIESIDVNPLIAGASGEGGWAVDAVIERHEGQQ
ncbi:acetate--CoA ligase family protein [Ramlibacter sp.]|uniref:acetate--CoA ligase family protein n=1 Tax=Ramlibacter sp. TaxID=1917967 RepID=UPI002A628B38|nr:putative acyl-CoA ligase [Ramlibacter sp.]